MEAVSLAPLVVELVLGRGTFEIINHLRFNFRGHQGHIASNAFDAGKLLYIPMIVRRRTTMPVAANGNLLDGYDGRADLYSLFLEIRE